MIIDLSFLTSDTVILCVIAFLTGLGGMMAYNAVASFAKRPKQDRGRSNDAIIEAVVSEYTRRLQDYDKVISEMRIKLDLIEIRSAVSQDSRVTSETSQGHHAASLNPSPHTLRVSDPVAITQHPLPVAVSRQDEAKNGTMDYILKMLAEKPRSSREVQQAIGRSREHTSRLLKKLNDTGLVTRSDDSKPFKYIITALGRSRLHEKPGAAEQPTRGMSTPFLDES